MSTAAGFGNTAGGLLIGSRTALDSSSWFVPAWMAVVGLGMGVGFATAASVALKTVPSRQSGVASALLQAMQKVGAPFGSAVPGSILVTSVPMHVGDICNLGISCVNMLRLRTRPRAASGASAGRGGRPAPVSAPRRA